MEYKVLANPRIRQEAQRCLRSYHEAYRHRQVDIVPSLGASTHASSSSLGNPDSVHRHGPCWSFYRGEVPASPGREYVDDLLAYGGECSSGFISPCWSPAELEGRHDYIQWLFPLRERGVNRRAPLLTTAEACEMRHDGLIMARVLQAFRVMLRFYGTEICYVSSSSTLERVCVQAELRRTPNPTERVAQYDNLLRRSHNYLRVSRILQFLGEVGLERLKVGWLEYLAHEVIAGGSVKAPLAACRDSFFFWMETPYEEEDKKRLQQLVATLASNPAPPASAARPVVVVRDLLLPSTLDLPRVCGGVPPSSSASKSTLPSADAGKDTKGAKRQRE